MKKLVAVLLAVVISLSFFGCHRKSENAKAVDEMIESIGEVTLDSADKLTEIDTAIEALTEEEKAELDNLEDLDAAKTKVAELESEKRIADVQASIDAIGTVTLKSQSAIEKAEKALKALSDEEQAKVANAATLTAARKSYDALKKAELKKKEAEGKKILAKFDKDVDEFQDVTWYMHKSMPKYIDTRSYIIPYIGKTSSQTYINIRYNYTGDDWVFFKRVTIVADGKKYYKTFKYFDITHDNQSGNVWEYIDEYASADDIEMLRAIAKSKTTKVRFEGDDFTYDMKVKDVDKKIMKDMLKAYDCFN